MQSTSLLKLLSSIDMRDIALASFFPAKLTRVRRFLISRGPDGSFKMDLGVSFPSLGPPLNRPPIACSPARAVLSPRSSSERMDMFINDISSLYVKLDAILPCFILLAVILSVSSFSFFSGPISFKSSSSNCIILSSSNTKSSNASLVSICINPYDLRRINWSTSRFNWSINCFPSSEFTSKPPLIRFRREKAVPWDDPRSYISPGFWREPDSPRRPDTSWDVILFEFGPL